MSLHVEIRRGRGDQLSPALVEWLVDHGLDPADLPERTSIVVRRGRVTTEQYMRDDRGRRYTAEGGHHIRLPVTVPLRRPYPIGEPP